MKKPNVADVRIYSDVCMFNINTDEYFTYMRDKQFNTILRSAFEEDSAKIAKALNLDRKKKAIIEEEFRKKNSENYYFIIEDENSNIMGIIELEDENNAEIIITDPQCRVANKQLNSILREKFKERVYQTINRFCFEIDLKFQAKEYEAK